LIYGLLDDSDFGDEDALAGSMALTSLIEGVAGYALAGYTEMSAGEAHGISTGNLAGMAAALEILAFLSPDDADARALSGFTLLGALAGSAGGKLLSDQRDWTWGDVEIIQTAILLGHFLGITGVVAVEPSSATSFVRATGLTLLLTGAAGLLVGDVLMDGFDATWWQGLAIELATLAGGFLGAGMLFVAGADDPKPIMIAGAVGGVAGFALSFLSMNIAREGASQAGAASAPIAIAPWFGAEGARGVSLGGSF
ncbi:MAG: hypothetical protein OEY14_14750, partial [Myxococcales bacterium]|nr:hypothetical protein [Myxococcales bacterium]